LLLRGDEVDSPDEDDRSFRDKMLRDVVSDFMNEKFMTDKVT
jgi:hypothetical protein